jgi:RNA recognition motif-containing protein
MMTNPPTKLFVGCLPYSKTESDVAAVFSRFGALNEVALLKNPDGSSKGAAFVTFASAECAQNATVQLQGYLFDGATRGINVTVAGSPSTNLGGKGASGGGMGQPWPNYNLGGGGGMAQPWSSYNMGAKGGGGGGMGMPWSSCQGGFPQPSFQTGFPMKGNWQQSPPSSQSHWQQLQPLVQKDVPGANCFVGKLPFSKSESDLVKLFSSCGPVIEAVLLKDKHTGEKKGAAFVSFATPQHAAAAVTALNGFWFHGATRPISVDIAVTKIDTTLGVVNDGSRKRPISAMGTYGVAAASAAPTYGVVDPNCKLFVGQLPFSKSEGAIKDVFQAYGSIVEVMLHRNASGQKTGGAFVIFNNPESASAALALNGYMFPGATRAIAVSIPTKRQRTEGATGL